LLIKDYALRVSPMHSRDQMADGRAYQLGGNTAMQHCRPLDTWICGYWTLDTRIYRVLCKWLWIGDCLGLCFCFIPQKCKLRLNVRNYHYHIGLSRILTAICTSVCVCECESVECVTNASSCKCSHRVDLRGIASAPLPCDPLPPFLMDGPATHPLTRSPTLPLSLSHRWTPNMAIELFTLTCRQQRQWHSTPL